MPYSSNGDLPDAVKKLSDHAQSAFRNAFNAALEQYGSEEKAFAVAWSAAKKADGRDDDESESREAELDADRRDDLEEDQFAFPDQRKLPIHDAAHVRNAIARFNQTQGMSAEDKKAAWARIKRAAKRHGVEMADEDESESREAQQPPSLVTTNRAAWDDGTLNMTPAQTERPVRESTVQSPTVRANIVREGRGYRIKDCQIMAAGAGNAMMQNVYEPEAIEALVPEVKRQSKAFLDHSLPQEVRERGHRSLRDLAGVYDKRTVRYDPQTQACLADLIVRPTVYDEYVAPVLEAGDNLGISVDGVGHCPDKPRHVKGWRRFNSADLVPAGGARGFIVREANSPAQKQAEREFAMGLLDEVTVADVRESAPALFEEIGKQYANATGGNSTAPSTAPAAPDGQHSARLAALEARVREAEERAEASEGRVFELEAERNRADVAAFVQSTVRECGITEDKQVTFVAQRFSGATMGPAGTYTSQEALEAAVREAAEEFKAVLPPEPRGGQIVGLGWGAPSTGKFSAPARQDKVIVDAVDWLFGAPPRPAAAPSTEQPAANGAQGGA